MRLLKSNQKRQEYKEKIVQKFETLRKKLNGQLVIVTLSYKKGGHTIERPVEWIISAVVFTNSLSTPEEECSNSQLEPQIGECFCFVIVQ